MEMYVYYSIIFFATIISALYIYIIWIKTYERHSSRKKQRYHELLSPLIDEVIEDILAGKEITIYKKTSLIRKIAKDKYRMAVTENRMIYYLEKLQGDAACWLISFCEEMGLIDYEIKELSRTNVYAKALACKKLGELKSQKAVPYLLKEVSSPSPDITYNALLALAKIGDTDSFLKAFESINSSILLSERSLIEIADSFEGDKTLIYKRMIDSKDEFISCIFIKSAGSLHNKVLANQIASYLKGATKERTIAALKALGNIADPSYSYDIAMLLKHDSWEVRAIAAKALGSFKHSRVIDKVIDKLIDALSDGQWFVRYNAATSLLKLDKKLSFVTKVFRGTDRFAKDILISAMESSGKLSQLIETAESTHYSTLKESALLIKHHIEKQGETNDE